LFKTAIITIYIIRAITIIIYNMDFYQRNLDAEEGSTS